MNKSLAKNSFYNLVYNLVNVLFPLFTSVYVSRVILPEGVGRVAYANTIVSYFITFAALGLPSYGIRAISRVRNNQYTKNRVFSELLIINAINTTIAIIIYVIMILFIPKFYENHTLYFVVGIQLLFAYFSIDWFYLGEENYKYITIRNFSIKIIAFILLFIIVKTVNDYIKYAFIISATLALNNIFNIIYSRQFVHITLNNINLREHIKPVLTLATSIAFATIYSQIDITMLGNMATDFDVGVYSNAHKIINLIITGTVALTSVYLPRLSFLYEKDKKEFERLINQGINIVSFISLPATIGLIIIAKDAILWLYGDEFIGSATILLVFTPLILIKGYGNLLCHQVVISINKEKILIPSVIIATLLNIILNFLLIPNYGGCGAAVASVASELVYNTILFIIIKQHVKFKLINKSFVKCCFATIIMGILLTLIKKISLPLYLSCIITCLFGVILYFFICIIIKNSIALQIWKKCLRQ